VDSINPPLLSPDATEQEQATFFRAVLKFWDEKSNQLAKKKVAKTSLEVFRKILISTFIWKHLEGCDADVAVNFWRFRDKDLTVEVLGALNKFLTKCGLSKTDRLSTLMHFKDWMPGRGNGFVGNFCKKWSSARSWGMAWCADPEEEMPEDNSGAKVSVPWVGQLFVLHSLCPTNDRFSQAGAMHQESPDNEAVDG